jgi:hypothetical protein
LYCLWNKELPNTQTNHIDQAESDRHQVSSLRAYHGNQLTRACYRTQATVQRLESDILTLLSMDEKYINQIENQIVDRWKKHVTLFSQWMKTHTLCLCGWSMQEKRREMDENS